MAALPATELSWGVSASDDCAELYSQQRPALVRYVRTRFPRVDAEGVVQETFCRTMRHWATVRELENPWPWLIVTARNIALNTIRDDRTEAVGLQVGDRSADDGFDVVDRIDSADQLRRLGKAMETLTPLQRQLLTVVLEEGLTGAEAARRLGLGAGAARMHLCRMRARLSERFVALGGRLAVTPAGLLAWMWRRLRSAATRPPKSALATAGGFAATSVVAMSLGVATVVLSPSHGDAASFGSRSAVESRNAAVNTVMQPQRARRLAPAHLTTPGSATDVAPGLVPARHHANVSTTPTKPGTTLGAGLEVDTPTGSIYVDSQTEQQHDAQNVVCAQAGVC